MDTTNATNRLRQRLRTSLRAALKARAAATVAALRSVLSAIDNAEAVERPQATGPAAGTIAKARLGVGVGDVARHDVTSHEVAEILRGEVTDREAAAAEYERLGRAEQASRLRAEAAALQDYLNDPSWKAQPDSRGSG